MKSHLSRRVDFGYAGMSLRQARDEVQKVLHPHLRPRPERQERLAILAEIMAEQRVLA